MNTNTSTCYHLISGDNGLCSTIIKETLSHFPDHRIIIYANRYSKSKYLREQANGSFLNELFFVDPKRLFFQRTYPKWHDILIRGINKIYRKFYQIISYDSYELLSTLQDNCLIIHGELSFFEPKLHDYIANHVANYAWVCWGGVEIMDGGVSPLFISRLKAVATLMLPDKDWIEKHYSHLRDKIHVVPYIFPERQFPVVNESDKTIDVLLGNSACYLDSYHEVLPTLAKIDCSIQCMVAYGAPEPDIHAFKAQYVSLFADRISWWERLLPIDAYIALLSQHKVYVSPIHRQSGLGAIYFSVFCGLKLYLTDRNYEWMKYLGLIVHHIDELQHISHDELCDWSSADSEFNKQQLHKMLNLDHQRQLWSRFFAYCQ